jgi:hypothetical protein
MDENLKTEHKDFWKYVSKSRKNDHSLAKLKIGANVITEPRCIVEAFADRFCSNVNSSSSVVIPNNIHFTLIFLNVPSISDFRH